MAPRPAGPHAVTFLGVASNIIADLEREAEESGKLHYAAEPEAPTATVAVAVAGSSHMGDFGGGVLWKC